MDEVKEKLSEPKTCPLTDKKLSKKEIEKLKKSQENGVWFLIIIFGIIILFIFLIYFFSANNDKIVNNYQSYNYNGYDFIYINTIWYTEKVSGNNIFQIKLNYGPKELEDIVVKGDLNSLVNNNDFFYFTSDPNNENHDAYVTLSVLEVATNLRLHFGKNFSAAYIMENEMTNEYNLTIINCDNTDLPVIFFDRNKNKKQIERIDNCIILSGYGEDLLKVADRFLYSLYEIMD
jgi:hypothetical protein